MGAGTRDLGQLPISGFLAGELCGSWLVGRALVIAGSGEAERDVFAQANGVVVRAVAGDEDSLASGGGSGGLQELFTAAELMVKVFAVVGANGDGLQGVPTRPTGTGTPSGACSIASHPNPGD